MKTNNLVYKANKIKGKVHTFVTIRLNDECKNGHQDFAITADLYEAGKPHTDRYSLGGGCCHDEILKAFPEFKIFVDLHLADYLGNPMYATANGYYHLTTGFNNTPVTSQSFPKEFCEYYRIDLQDFQVLTTAKNKVQYAMLLIELGIPVKWKAQADEAIKVLEELTGDEFIVDSVRNQFGMPTDEEIQAEKERIANGYYSETKVQERHEEAKQKYIDEIKAEASTKISSTELERDVKIMLFELGGEKLVENVIYYTHDKTLGFNWRGYGVKMEETEAKPIFEAIQSKYPVTGYRMK